MKDTREINDERTLVDDSTKRTENTIPTISRDNDGETNVGLLAENDLQGFRQRWDEVQAGFVDDPKSAVENADRLVEQTMRRLTETFARERANLEATWGRGEQANTEELRVALQRYRSFFNRLLSA